MRRLLLITYVYPSSSSVGAIRPTGLTKYLARFGWEAVVLTPKVQGAHRREQVIETENRDVLEDWKARLILTTRGCARTVRPARCQEALAIMPPHTRVLNFVRHLRHLPSPVEGMDPLRAWLPSGSFAGKIARFDAVISTSPPITTHLIACQAKRILGCPWIADMRDLWTQNLNPNYSIVQVLANRARKERLARLTQS